MALSRYKIFNSLKDREGKNRKAFLQEDKKKLIINYKSILYKIPIGEKYRPDLIAQKFYGSFKYHWLITYANGFFNSPEDYFTDRIIKIPNPSIINEL